MQGNVSQSVSIIVEVNPLPGREIRIKPQTGSQTVKVRSPAPHYTATRRRRHHTRVQSDDAMPELPGLTSGTDGTLVMLSATEGNHVILIVI